MSFEVQAARITDGNGVAETLFRSAEQENDPLMARMYPGTPWDLLIQSHASRYPRTFQRNPKWVRVIKVVDTSNGTIASYAKWVLPRDVVVQWGKDLPVADVTDEELKWVGDVEEKARSFIDNQWPEGQKPPGTEESTKAMYERGWPVGVDKFTATETSSALAEAAKGIKGNRAFIDLENLRTLPAYADTETEKMALQWGLDLADSVKLPVYTTIPSKLQPVFEALGFQHHRDIVIDMEKFGGEGEYKFLVFVREPRV